MGQAVKLRDHRGQLSEYPRRKMVKRVTSGCVPGQGMCPEAHQALNVARCGAAVAEPRSDRFERAESVCGDSGRLWSG